MDQLLFDIQASNETFYEIVLFVLAVACGLAIQTTLSIIGQRWSRTFSNVVTYLLLPVVGMVIVQLISTNIALSLGMIGALSIVRFRHPVKSPLELVIYFLLLTVGVALATKPSMAIGLTVMASIILTAVTIQRNRSKSISISPSDGDEIVFLQIETSSAVLEFQQSGNLLFSSEKMDEQPSVYRFGFKSKSSMDRFQEATRNDSRVISYTYSS